MGNAPDGGLDPFSTFYGSCIMGAAIVPQFRKLRDKLDPSNTDTHLKKHHLPPFLSANIIYSYGSVILYPYLR